MDGKIQSMMDTCLALLSDHFELFLIELQHEKRKLVGLVAMGIVCAFSLMMVAIVGTALVVLAVGPAHRWVAGIGFLVFYAVVAGGAGWMLWSRLREVLPMFSTTLEELEKDREWLQALK